MSKSLQKFGRKLGRLLPLRYATLEPDRQADLGRFVDPPSGYRPANPSIVQYGARRIVSVRCVNYTLASERSLAARFTSGTSWHSVNRFLVFGDGGAEPERLTALDPLFDGVEDLRLFVVGETLHAVGSVPSSEGKGCGMVLFTFAPGLDGCTRIALRSPFGLRHEKNWAPFVRGATLYLIYSLDPLVILRCDTHLGTLVRVVGGLVEANELAFMLSGSSQGVADGDGWLFVFHKRSVRLPGRSVIYLHYLVRLAGDLRRVTRSRAFVIGRPAIHFVGGMVMDEDGITLSYGRADRTATLAEFDRRTLLRWVGV